MLLLVSPPGDGLAAWLSAKALARGVDCETVDAWNQLSFSATSDNDGTVRARIRLRGAARPVRAILNRGVPSDHAGGEFAEAELLAAWWSVLAHWPGVVVNRPSRRGLFPRLVPSDLTAGAERVRPPDVFVGAPRDLRRFRGHAHVRRASNFQFVGHSVRDAKDDAELFVATRFRPSRTRHVLLAGDAVLDLGSASLLRAGAFQRHIEPVVQAARSEGADFARLVFETACPGIRLLTATPFPAVAEFQHAEEVVAEALLAHLLTSPA